MTTEIDWDRLVAEATAVRERAYAPYSSYKVGSAVLTSNGEIFVGCNVEVSTLPISVCAERSAVTTAVSAGHLGLVAVAVVTESSPPAPPCGTCLEFLRELAPTVPVMMANTQGERTLRRLDELLPFPFDR